jgi:hypothetical protein
VKTGDTIRKKPAVESFAQKHPFLFLVQIPHKSALREKKNALQTKKKIDFFPTFEAANKRAVP